MSHLERFSDRAEAYSSYRPSYPKAILDQLSHYGLTSKSVVADIGSGTGILSKLLLERGAEVFAIEPNQSMRNEAERLLGSVSGVPLGQRDRTSNRATRPEHRLDHGSPVVPLVRSSPDKS